jgi:nitrate/nitrite transporter NarK
MADRISASRVSVWSFALMAAGSMLIASGIIQPGLHWLLISTVCATSIGINALRGIYFALLEEGKVPVAVTGTAVGIVSFLGYTPDVFMGPLMGVLLDRSPGVLGHQHFFAVVAAFAVVGMLMSLIFSRHARGLQTSG